MASKRRRIVTSKPSKNACRTCRTRRIKCDEARPSCQRCSSTGRTCDGYPAVSCSRDDSVSKRALLPAYTTQSYATLSLALSYAYGNVPATDTERNAFTFFIQETAPPLERIFGPQEWVRQALQVGAELPTVFKAITAVGCIAYARAQIHVADHTLTQLKTGMKEEVALHQYCKATFSLQKYIDDAVVHGATIEPVLICSLLFVLFEVFRGEASLALSHLRHARRVLQTANGANSPTQGCNLSSKSRSATNELLSMFDLLGRESVQFDRPVESAQGINLHIVTESHALLPAKLESMEHAKHCLESLTVETFRWREELLMITESHLADIELNELSVAARYCVTHCLSRSVDASRHQSLLGKRDYLISAHEHWLQMLATLAADGTHQSVMLMQLQHFYSYFLLVTSRDTMELPVDRFQGEFKRVLDIADRYIDHQNRSVVGPAKPASCEQQLSFSLEAGPLPILFLTCLKCRDQDLRTRALDLLRNANRREGLQWSGELSVYADCIVEFEEERAKRLRHEDADRPLDWWFQRIPEAARYPSLVIQGVGYQEIRVIGCRYLQEHSQALELVELGAAGTPPLHLQELQRTTIDIPASAQDSSGP